jgi:glyoxylase-like metal-dependent hydrolase (beta-lactamase superfamily II)
MRAKLFAVLLASGILAGAQTPRWTIEAIRYATIPGFRVRSLVLDAPAEERMDIAMAFWLIRSPGRNVLFDAGFHRPEWFGRFEVRDFMRPDSALRLAGVEPGAVTDIIVSHAHWDHMGGIDLFPNATIWIQRDEFTYYVRDAWQEGGRSGGIDPADVAELVRRNAAGKVRLIDGDDVEILPGIRAYTGARHTFASQYIRVEADPAWVLASDNAYLYRNIASYTAGATFEPGDRESNVAALRRMVQLAGSAERVVPGHDPLQFTRSGAQGRIARIR